MIDLKATAARRRQIERASRLAELDRALPRRQRRRAWLATVALVSLGLAVGGLGYWTATATGRELRRLPAAERATLLRSARSELEDLCEPAPPLSLRVRCQRDAELLMQLDECDDSCQQLARRHLHRAVR